MIAPGLGMGTFRVHLPSGNTVEFVGTLREVDLGPGDGVCDGILLSKGTLVLLDPRAVVLCDGAVVADPRQRDQARLAPWVREWLAANPEWPRVVTEAC